MGTRNSSLMRHQKPTPNRVDIPVELWISVFDIVLQTWLLPHPNFNLIDSMMFLEQGCVPIKEYFRVERARVRLRLVCKQWNAIISPIPTHLAIKDLRSESTSNYARISDRLHTDDHLCSCGIALSPEMCRTRRLLAARQQREEEKYRGPQVPFRTRVLLTTRILPEQLDGFLESNPPLQCLSIVFCSFVVGHTLLSSPILRQITHLRLNSEPGATNDIVHITLPNLVVLDYDVYLRTFNSEVFNGPAPIGSWSLPKLRTLIIRQVAIIGKLPPAFNEFILAHKLTLTELVIYCTTTDYPLREANHLLELVPLLPNLKIFGMDAQGLLRKTPDFALGSSAERDRTLLLDRFALISLDKKTTDRIKEGFEALFIHTRVFTHIWLYSTWEELGRQGLGRQRLPFEARPFHIIETLQYARDLGIPLQDREGVSLSDKQWTEWMKRLS
ncbi:hypothetical protein FRC17_008088 [Serendipita sp. 399]|nr:hypothetical protein FRC17_008088 [Serendipita sp. 399]